MNASVYKQKAHPTRLHSNAVRIRWALLLNVSKREMNTYD